MAEAEDSVVGQLELMVKDIGMYTLGDGRSRLYLFIPGLILYDLYCFELDSLFYKIYNTLIVTVKL